MPEPSSNPFPYALEATSGRARAGVLGTPHGSIHTPAFMPVGTHGAVKAMTPSQVRATGAEVILANTYHLALRPGEALVELVQALRDGVYVSVDKQLAVQVSYRDRLVQHPPVPLDDLPPLAWRHALRRLEVAQLVPVNVLAPRSSSHLRVKQSA